MDKKITLGLVAGIAAGIAIYLLSKVIKEKRSSGQNDRDRLAKSKKIYAYEYTL